MTIFLTIRITTVKLFLKQLLGFQKSIINSKCIITKYAFVTHTYIIIILIFINIFNKINFPFQQKDDC